MSEKIIGFCPHCGEELEIPARLEEFSCLYCGKRSRTELLALQKTLDEGSLFTAAAELPCAIKQYKKLSKTISKKDYVPAFEAYEAEHKARLTELDLVICANPRGIESGVKTLCEEFLNALEKELEKDKRYGSKSGKTAVLFEVKVVLALFLTPLLRKLHLRSAEPLREELLSQWMQRYPKENWTPGDYEAIAGGFRKGKLCFITTATCLHEGKKDDCPELTAFRRFRDGWLTENGDGELIEAYYELAPAIVTLIDHCDDTAACYGEIRSRWLEPCMQALEQGQPEFCRQRYIHMVESLKNRYLQ